MSIVVNNLPADISNTDLQQFLHELGLDNVNIELHTDGNPQQVLAVLSCHNEHPLFVKAFAGKLNGTVYRGRILHTYVPLFSKTSGI